METYLRLSPTKMGLNLINKSILPNNYQRAAPGRASMVKIFAMGLKIKSIFKEKKNFFLFHILIDKT